MPNTAPAEPELHIGRVPTLTDEAMAVVEEFYAAAGVWQRDDADALRGLLADTQSAMWLARFGGEVAGCVVLRAGVPDAASAECKRLYVRPAFRRRGVADALMETLEGFARTNGVRAVYLDTTMEFAASVALYRARGYIACERYNRNPQASLFFRKEL